MTGAPAPGNPPDERRCIHSSKENNGDRCKRWAHPGTTVCVKHGANNPAIKRKIAERKAKDKILAWAQTEVAKSGTDIDPAAHLVGSLLQAQGMLAYYGSFLSRLDEESQSQARGGLRGALQYSLPKDELDELAVSSNEMLLGFNRHGEAMIHPFVEQFNWWFDKHAKLAEMCLKAGIAERRVRLAEEQGQLLVRIIRAHDRDLERKYGVVILADPDYPAMMRRHLALGGGDVIEG